ncbi:hypothetical protein SEA_EVEPICKLES_71 [Arthrobacter phage EvePickles]|nr:hypothetical protein SEA_EVEPICKLES_71 [Arthrobacter phage EvePickles]
MKKIAAVILALSLILGATACSPKSEALQERENLQKQSAKGTSLEISNLKKKRDLEENPNVLRYVYIMNYGKIVGYYVAKGKISSSGSQIAPQQDLIRICDTCSDRYIVDSAQDDGSYGDGDPGIFFFTTDDVMVETSLDYIVSNEPMAIDVPRLSK